MFFLSHLAEHPWIQNAKKAPNVPLGDVVKSRLKQFSMMNRFKRKALRVGSPYMLISLACGFIMHSSLDCTFENRSLLISYPPKKLEISKICSRRWMVIMMALFPLKN